LQILQVRTVDDFDNALLAPSNERCEAVVLLLNPVFVGALAVFMLMTSWDRVGLAPAATPSGPASSTRNRIR